MAQSRAALCIDKAVGIDTAAVSKITFSPHRLRVGNEVTDVLARDDAGLCPLGLRTPRSFSSESGLVPSQKPFEHGFDGRSFVLVEHDGGLEGQAQRIVVGESGITAKDQSVTTDRQGDGQFAHDAERGFGEPLLIAAELVGVHPDSLGQRRLRQSTLTSERSEIFGEAHEKHTTPVTSETR
jgi:hypothetical protein